jgi:CubicO group peptidase (beta-lactamase class C family)
MKLLIPFLVVVFTAISCNNNGKNTEGDSATKAAIIQTFMNETAQSMLSDSTITSVSIGILKDGIAYTSHYGALDAGKKNPPNDETIYEIASVTKTLTGTLVAQAVLDGKLNLDDDIRKYLKEDYPNFQYKNEVITIRHLVTHTSRLPANWTGFEDAFKKEGDSIIQKIVEIGKNYNEEKFFKQIENAVLDTIPGVIYEYNNLAPNLMAHILENVYQKSFDELLNDFIFKKNGMTSTKIRLSEGEQSRLANGYSKGQLTPYFPIPTWGAAGGIKSTTSDLIKYMRLQLDTTNATIVESHRLNFTVSPTFSLAYYWNIGNNSDGTIHYSHHGGAVGMQNLFSVYPAYHMGVSIVTNSSESHTGDLLHSTVRGLVNDLKPNGKKSIEKKITPKTMQNVDGGIALYHQLKKENIDAYNFGNQNELNNLGYALLSRNKVKEAIKIFTLLVSEFPKLPNPYDSLGEAYFIIKEYELALKNYKTSLELNPENRAAAEMIAKIEKLIQ